MTTKEAVARKLAEQAGDSFCAAPKYWLERADEILAIADRSASAPRRETGVARKGKSGDAGTAIAQGQVT